MAERPRSLEGLVMDRTFWNGKAVLVTGHTGFKGSWLSTWLQDLEAQVSGLALEPPTSPSMFHIAHVAERLHRDVRADIRDLEAVQGAVAEIQPEIIFHLAAQSLVRPSYTDPVGTYASNVMGCVHVMEAARRCKSVRAVVVVTSDKCYHNNEWPWAYRETDPMGGHDPYSSSKGCAELVVAAYRASYFDVDQSRELPLAVATARAGNVIGGGDWARDRLIPDLIRCIESAQVLQVRSPSATRPWQHVLEPLSGYLMLAEALSSAGTSAVGGWNFGPVPEDEKPVAWLVNRLSELLGNTMPWADDKAQHPHEAQSLKLDISKTRAKLRWAPRWSLDRALQETASWYRAAQESEDMRGFSINQIHDYTAGT
jgi:CDP-glucose 4,6-dehydratase